MSGDPRVVQIVLAEPLAEESVNELVLEFAGEEFPFADANSYSTRQFLWEQSWLSDNAPSLSSDCFATTLPLGGTAGVCLRTTEQTCPPTASSSAQRCPAPASAQASAEPEIIFVPLIARFRDVPEEHDGSTAFTLQLAFNEPIEDDRSGDTASADSDRRYGDQRAAGGWSPQPVGDHSDAEQQRRREHIPAINHLVRRRRSLHSRWTDLVAGRGRLRSQSAAEGALRELAHRARRLHRVRGATCVQRTD